jgi:putative membrane protein
MRRFLMHWLLSSVALAVTAWILPGVSIETIASLLAASLVLGFLNAVLKPLLVLLTLPLTIVTLGIFYFVLNGLLFALGAAIVPGFVVTGFGWAFLGAILMSLFSMFLSGLAADDAKRAS